jgi:hypothetical protein
MSDWQKWALGISSPLVVAALFFSVQVARGAVDEHFLVRAEFDSYVQQQTIASQKSDLRQLQRRKADLEAERDYGEPTPERAAQLQALLVVLEQQIGEVQMELAPPPESN